MHRPSPSPRPRARQDIEGVLLVDKPAGPTSHDVVDAVRRLIGPAKVGHGGTLDPGATGLLVVLIGRATKWSAAVMNADKTYEGSLLLGVTTDTHDADGIVIARGDPSGVTPERLAAEMRRWVGDIEQIPPMVSAVKKDGVALYKLAREGKEIEREPRIVHIYEFSLRGVSLPLVFFRVRCSKGTYVRTLCHDLGQQLGCGACLNTLRRTQSGQFSVSKAVPFEDLIALNEGEFRARLLPVSSLKTAPSP